MTDTFEDDIFEDYEPEFEEGGDVVVDPNTQISLKYGMETVLVDLSEGKTVAEYLSDAAAQLQFRNLEGLSVRLDAQFINTNTVPQAGQVFVVSAQGDRKGA